jgi:hypothetical protein
MFTLREVAELQLTSMEGQLLVSLFTLGAVSYLAESFLRPSTYVGVGLFGVYDEAGKQVPDTSG